MSLLQEIDTQSRLQPLKSYFEGLEELGLDPSSEVILLNIQKMIMEACGADEDTPLEEMGGRSEYQASMDLLKARGMHEPEMARRREMIQRAGLDNPRLGLQGKEPEVGNYVKLGGGAGVGKVVGVRGDNVAVKNKAGYTIETSLQSLRPQQVRNPKTGENIVVWVERM